MVLIDTFLILDSKFWVLLYFCRLGMMVLKFYILNAIYLDILDYIALKQIRDQSQV
jgi:hypothetical protein